MFYCCDNSVIYDADYLYELDVSNIIAELVYDQYNSQMIYLRTMNNKLHAFMVTDDYVQFFCDKTYIPEIMTAKALPASRLFAEKCEKEMANLEFRKDEVIIKMYTVNACCVALTSHGRIITYGKHQYFLLAGRKVKNLDVPKFAQTAPVKNVFCSVNHLFVICKNNDLMGMGKNDHGTIGLKIKQFSFSKLTFIRSNVQKVANEHSTTFILDLDGNLTCHGIYMNPRGVKAGGGGEIFATDIMDFNYVFYNSLSYVTKTGLIVRDGRDISDNQNGYIFFNRNERISFRPDHMQNINFSIFREELLTFLLCLKRLRIGFNIVPRFLLYDIIRIYFS